MGNPERQDIAQTFYCHVRSGVTFGIAWNTPPGWGFCLLMCNTPETPTTTRVTARHPGDRRSLAVPEARADRLDADRRPPGRADPPPPDPRYLDDEPRADKSVPADAAGLRYRQLRAALAERQAAGDFSYRDGWRGPDAAAAILMDGRIPDPA